MPKEIQHQKTPCSQKDERTKFNEMLSNILEELYTNPEAATTQLTTDDIDHLAQCMAYRVPLQRNSKWRQY